MLPFIRDVRETILRHHMLLPHDRLLVGVSGGADSTALLLALQELGYRPAIAHVNHGLRGAESDEDERFVRDLATRLQLPCFSQSVAVATATGNLEAAGREARKKFFQGLVRDQGFTKIAVAHNRDDRVETFLLHLMRGAGAGGLTSMAAVTGNVIRPLIATSREEILAFLTGRGQAWRADSSNLDMSFARNRMRLEVLPRLASLFNAQLADTLTRTITVLEDEDRWMNHIAEAWLQETGAATLDVAVLREAPVALSRRLIRNVLRQSSPALTDVSFDRIEAVRGLLEDGKSGRSVELPGGVVAMREFNRLVVSQRPHEPMDFSYELSIPGSLRVPELGRIFRATLASGLAGFSESPTRVLVDGGRLGPSVKVRSWKPGDYYRPAGWPAGKVKKLFQRARVPRSQRARWPLFVTDSAIIWVTSFPVSREFLPGANSKKIVAFETLEG